MEPTIASVFHLMKTFPQKPRSSFQSILNMLINKKYYLDSATSIGLFKIPELEILKHHQKVSLLIRI
jgi:hypothetical protein